MQIPRSMVAVTLLGALVAACGGTTPATQGPDGPGATSNNGGQATQDPGPGQTQSGGNGGNGGGQYGSVKFTVSGPFDKTDEYEFVPAGSLFGTAGGVLSFYEEGDTTSILSILIGEDGSVLVSYAGLDGQVPGAECTTRDWNIQAQSGSGKFDCTAAFSITGAGATVEGGKIVGEFTART
jgi:hypothetical protein